MKKALAPAIFIAVLIALAFPALSAADEDGGLRMDASLRFIASAWYGKPNETGPNPVNMTLNLPDRGGNGETRLDLGIEGGPLYLWARPRATADLSHWDSGKNKGECETDRDLYLIEGGARARLHERLFLIAGRENLQWGPAQLLSPSNPFFPMNTRDNPMRELGGMDFVRAVYVYGGGFSLSLMANVGPGEAEPPPAGWHPSEALKIDWTGTEGSLGITARRGEKVEESVGAFGQWTLNDALILYGDAGVSFGNRLPYPAVGAGPLGGRLEYKYEDSRKPLPAWLLGASYTTLYGPALYVEYLRNESGLSPDESDLLIRMATRLGTLAGQGFAVPAGSLSSTGTPLGRNHLLLQLYDGQTIRDTSVILRLTMNLDDKSAAIGLYADHALSDRWRVYATATVMTGGAYREYGMAMTDKFTLGAEFSAF